MTRSFQTMLPQYMRQFACIGGDCEDTCCSGGWTILIDKSTYNKYQQVRDPELRSKVKQSIHRIKTKEATDSFYALMGMNEQGSCNFLNEDKLCSIHAKLGDEGLCNTCAIYPRVVNQVDNMMEIGSKMSCPETARLALLNRSPMEFDVVEQPLGFTSIFARLNTQQSDSLNPYFWDLRIFIISLIQNRHYSIADRLIILGLFCEKLDAIYKSNDLDQVRPLIERYKLQIQKNEFEGILNNTPDAYHVSVKLLSKMLHIRGTHGTMKQNYSALLEEVVQGLQFSSQDDSAVIANYKEGYRKIYEPFMKDHEYIFENYVVNYVFESLFLFEKDKGLFQQYIQLISIFSMIKFLLIGLGLKRGTLSPEIAVQLIQTFSRNVEHNKGYLTTLVESVEDTGVNPLALMFIALKN